MSWKGFSKGVVRAPQTFRQKMNMGHVTKDPVYADAERRFEAIETQTKKLHTESKRYWDAINNMLVHQIEFSKAIEEIYQPISGSASDPDSAKPEGNPEGIAACEQYRDLVIELQQLLKPELEMIETRILKPADELLTITQSIKKMLVKRDHKKLDLDRHGNALKKLQDKRERSVKEEEKMYKVENDYAIANEEYNYFNELLKDELPKLFALESQFIRPLFQSFYYMQLNIFYTLYMHMEDMKIPYFQLESGIMEQYTAKRGDIKERTEEIPLTHFRIGHAKAKLEATKRKFARPEGTPGLAGAPGMPGAPGAAPPGYPGYGMPQITGYDAAGQPIYGPAPVPVGYDTAGQPIYQPQAQPAYAAAPGAAPGAYPGAPGAPAPYAAAPGAYQPAAPGAYPPEKQVYQPAAPGAYPPEKQAYQPAAPAIGSSPGTPLSSASPAPVPVPAPVPAPAAAPVAAAAGVEYCTAIYDYAAQAAGDLSFSAGDKIEVVQRTADANGWWTGKLNGQQGVFPGNYVQLG